MICEGCIKQDTCKFKEVVEEYEDSYKLPLPLGVYCPHKECFHVPIVPNSGTATTWDTYTSPIG